jgi:hypothetical protein
MLAGFPQLQQSKKARRPFQGAARDPKSASSTGFSRSTREDGYSIKR